MLWSNSFDSKSVGTNGVWGSISEALRPECSKSRSLKAIGPTQDFSPMSPFPTHIEELKTPRASVRKFHVHLLSGTLAPAFAHRIGRFAAGPGSWGADRARRFSRRFWGFSGCGMAPL